MATVAVECLSSAQALRGTIHRPGMQPTAAPADFCRSLPWYEHLAAHGWKPEETPQGLFLMATEAAQEHWLCLPLCEGQTLAALSNYYTSLYGPLGSLPDSPEDDDQKAVLDVLWEALGSHFRRQKKLWPCIFLQPMDPASRSFADLRQALTRAGYWVDHFFCFGNWHLQVSGRSFDAYYTGLPSRLRNSIERGQRKLDKMGEWHIQWQCGTGEGLEPAIADFVQVYNSSWKEPEPNPTFIPGLIRLAAAQGWLRLGVLKLEQRPIAAQLWLVHGTTASIYKLAYAQGFEKFSVGSLLTRAMMRRALDVDRVHEVDYLTGDEPYKRDWMSHRRERWGIAAFHPGTLPGLWQGCRHWVGKQFQKWRRL